MSFIASDALAADTTTTGTVAPTSAPEISTNTMMADNLMLLAAIFFIFYFILLRPQQQRLKAHKELLKSLTKGQKVITTGGLIGTIAKLEGESVAVIEISQGVKVRISRDAIVQLASGESAESANDN